MSEHNVIGVTVEYIIPREWLDDPDQMDRLISYGVREFRDKFIMAVEAAEDDPEAVLVASGSAPLTR